MGQSSQTTQTDTGPWQPQQGYLTGAFQNAQNAYNTNTAQGPYTGNYIAPTNSNEYTAASDLYNFGTGQGSTANTNLLNAGSTDLANSTANTGSAGGMLSSLFNGNTASGLNSSANTIASGFNVPAEVAAAMQPAEQAASESTLPNLYANASVTGNLNNNRTAVDQGVVQQGLAQNAQSLSAELQNQDYGTGLTTAENMTGQNAGIASALGSLGSSEGMLGTMGIGSGETGGINLGSAAENGAQTTQNLDQSNLNNSIDQYTQNQQYPYTQLQDLMSIIGGNYGSTSNSTTTTNPSLLSDIGGGLGALGGLFGLGTGGLGSSIGGAISGLGSLGSSVGSLGYLESPSTQLGALAGTNPLGYL